MVDTVQRTVSEYLDPSVIKIDKVNLYLIVNADNGKLIERSLDIHVSHDNDAIDAVEAEMVERIRSESGKNGCRSHIAQLRRLGNGHR